MPKIHKLSSLLISKIAAGEVIERPAFAVKELIENAIDANATEIKVYIEESGLQKIQVIDNGEGMLKEDLLESWKPHTTSKLTREDELHAIQSLGFRGEALASLAAVSRLTIKSRLNTSAVLNKSEQSHSQDTEEMRLFVNTQDDNAVGFEVVVENGKLLSTSPVGMAPGTVVTVEDLFANTPARKKFLKSPQTELRHIIDTVNNFAMSFPHIQFGLTHGKRELLNYPSAREDSERVEQLVGTDIFSFLIPIKKTESYVKLAGFIAKPQVNSTVQNKQYIFVNSRKVSDKLISQAVKEAFGTMLEATAYPIFVLFLEVPFEMVDVNVHPRKEQVSFVNNQFIFQTVKQLISEILEENNVTFQNLSWKRTGVGMTKSYAGKFLKENVLDKESFGIEEKTNMFQLRQLYIICSSKSGLVVVDQHAAHERILFEKLQREFLIQKNKAEVFKLAKPVNIKLTQSEKVLLEENKYFFEQLGFVILNESEESQLGTNKTVTKKIDSSTSHRSAWDDSTFVFTHIPVLFQDRDPKELLWSLLENLENETGLKDIDKVSEEMLAFLACRAAVKAGDVLTREQMKKIVADLENTPNNSTCPHGRPTRITFPLRDLTRMFGR